MILSEYGVIADQFWVDLPKHFAYAELDEYVVMPNHIHGIIVVGNECSNKNGHTDNNSCRTAGKWRSWGCCGISAGGDVPKDDFSEIQTEKQQIPIYANGEKNNGLYGFTSIPKITKPSITVSARGTIGFSVKRLESFYPIVRLIVVTPKRLQDLDLSYLEYSLYQIAWH